MGSASDFNFAPLAFPSTPTPPTTRDLAYRPLIRMIGQDLIRTNLEWVSTLTVDAAPQSAYRKTSIIATIGPKSNSVEMLVKLRRAGMNIVRMNFSHGSYEYHKSVIDNTRKAVASEPGRPLAIALDTKGPEIRTGLMTNDTDVPIAAGTILDITTDDQYKESGSIEHLYVDYKNLPKVIDKGKIIYVDDGVLSFEVQEVHDKHVVAKCLNNGNLCSRKGVNLPGTDVDLPALSEKDKADLLFGVENGVDIIFASFIRRASDVVEIRKCLGEKGKKIAIVSKIENQQGVNNFDEILRETDGVMVARGDLGIEIPPPQVFLAQKMMIAKCNLIGKSCICATQMLESMTYNPRPTRAEVSDVANAVLDGADCVMLSGETAKGSYPIEAVRMMHETCLLAETAICYPPLFSEIRSLTPRPTATTETVCCAAVSASLEQNASAIIALTTSGNTARLISKYRPRVPILIVTRNSTTARQVHLYRGCYPFEYPEPRPNAEGWQDDVDKRLKWGMKGARDLGLLKTGDSVVAIQGWKIGQGHTNTMRVINVPEDLDKDSPHL